MSFCVGISFLRIFLTNIFLNIFRQLSREASLYYFQNHESFRCERCCPWGAALRMRVVYKFSRGASCNTACYVGKNNRHFSTGVCKHLLSDRSLSVLRHLQSSESFRTSCTPDCFEILDSALTKYHWVLFVKLRLIHVHKMGETLAQPEGETHLTH